MTTTDQPLTLTRDAREPPATPVAAAVLRVTGIGKAFHRGIWPIRRSVQVLNGATLEVMPGELIGLVGENGSGKSTLGRSSTGFSLETAAASSDPASWGIALSRRCSGTS